jgi:hypothetical protein
MTLTGLSKTHHTHNLELMPLLDPEEESFLPPQMDLMDKKDSIIPPTTK